MVSGLGIRLQVFQNELIRQITGHNEIDLTLPGKKKCAYFCITSDQDSTFDFLSSLFMSFVFIKLVRYADEQDDCKLPVPVHILADEIANGGCTIADLTKKDQHDPFQAIIHQLYLPESPSDAEQISG